MRIDRARLSEICSWLLVLCVVVTTVLVVRREFVHGSPATEVTSRREATYVEKWQEALSVGLRSGPSDAPVQVVEFADFQCPYCARFEATVRTIREEYPDQVAFTLVHFPLPQHSLAESAARVAECSYPQGRFEEVRSVLFEKQQAFDSTPLSDFAKQVGIADIKQFQACVNDVRPVERIEQGKKLALQWGIRGTPTIIVNGWKLPRTPSSEDLDKIVRNVLAGKSPAAEMDFLAASTRK